MKPSLGNLQKRIDTLAENNLASILINNKNKRSKANTVVEDVISDIYYTILRE